MKAPVIGGVRIPTGNGQEVRLRQGASLADLAEKINVNPGGAGHRAVPSRRDGHGHPVPG